MILRSIIRALHLAVLAYLMLWLLWLRLCHSSNAHKLPRTCMLAQNRAAARAACHTSVLDWFVPTNRLDNLLYALFEFMYF